MTTSGIPSVLPNNMGQEDFLKGEEFLLGKPYLGLSVECRIVSERFKAWFGPIFSLHKSVGPNSGRPLKMQGGFDLLVRTDDPSG